MEGADGAGIYYVNGVKLYSQISGADTNKNVTVDL